ncbi:MAG: IPT/TIG domain-containing protein [Caldilineaceae bacterium]
MSSSTLCSKGWRRKLSVVLLFGLLGLTWSSLTSEQFTTQRNTVFLPMIKARSADKVNASAHLPAPVSLTPKPTTASLSLAATNLPIPATPAATTVQLLEKPKPAPQCNQAAPCTPQSSPIPPRRTVPTQYALFLSFISAHRPKAELAEHNHPLTQPSGEAPVNRPADPNCLNGAACAATASFNYLPLITANQPTISNAIDKNGVITHEVGIGLDVNHVASATNAPDKATCANGVACPITNTVATPVHPVTVTTFFGYLPLVAVNPTSAETSHPAEPPSVQAISPNTGLSTGGSTVTLTGAGFAPGATSILFGANAATSVVCENPTTCTATSPAGSGTVDVTVVVGNQSSTATAADQFTYTAPPASPSHPTVTAITPSTGPEMGNSIVTINGAGFAPNATTVNFGPNNPAASVTCIDTTTCIVVAPPGQGTVEVSVTVDNQASTAMQFTYVSAPTITSLTPNTGPEAGGTVVTINGTGFVPGATIVGFGLGNPATDANCMSTTTCTATSPSGIGTVDVRVSVANQLSTVSVGDQFTYTPAATVNN